MCATRKVSRRDFLLGGGALAVGGVAMRAAGGGDRTSTATMTGSLVKKSIPVPGPVRLGIVGGNFGAQFYFHEHPQCKVEAVADLIPERLAYMQDVYGCERGYASLEEMLDKAELDAVAVFTDGTRSADHCIAVLDRGLHVAGASPAAMTLDQARRLRDKVRDTGLVYMMLETSYYYQPVISARKWYGEGQFGRILNCESEYHHPGLEELFTDEEGRRTWRYGLPPMLYSTHCTGHFMAVTGERLTEVVCHGWGDDSPVLKDNAFNNPYWCETALYKSAGGATLRAAVYWRGALGIAERATWIGENMSFFPPSANCNESIIRRSAQAVEMAAERGERISPYQKYDQELWWQTDMLPEPLRHISPHDGSHTFLTHAFINSLVTGEPPPMGVELALDMAIPGILAHQSAMEGGVKMSIPGVWEI